MAEIKQNEIAQKGLLDGFVKDANKGLKALNEFNKGLKESIKLQGELQKQGSKDTTSKGLKKQADNFKKVDTTIKQLNDTQKVSLQISKERDKALLKLKKLNSDRIQGVVQLNRLTKEQNAINKDAEILSTKNIGTLTKLSAANRKLIREQKGLNLETEKGRKRLKEINTTLDKNTKFIKDNSSAMQKQSQNVGNYSESIKEAAGASGLFGKILGPLAAVQGTLNALLKKNTVENQASAAATKANAASTKKLSIAQKASALATGIGTKALKIFKFALASTGIGLLVVALGSMIAFFSRSQKGIDFLKVKMAGLGAVVDVIIDAFASFGEAIFNVFSEPKKLIESLITFIKKIPGLVLDNIINRFKAFGVIIQALIKGDLKGLANGFIQLGTGVTDFSDKAVGAIKKIKEVAAEAAEAARVLALEMAEKARIAQKLQVLMIKLNREELLFTAQQAATSTEIAKQTLIFKDKLKSDKERLAAVQETNRLEIKLSERQLELEKKALAASLDSLSSDEKSLKLDSERLKFIEDIKNGTIDSAEAVEKAAGFTLSSAEGEEALKDVIEKVNALEAAKLALLVKQATTAKRTASVTKEIATKNAQAFTRKAAAFRELAKDQEKSINDRIDLLTDAAVLEIESFRVQKEANIKNAKELAAAKLQIETKLQAAIKKLLPDFEALAKKQVEVVNKIEQELLSQQIKGLERRLENEELNADERIELINEIAEIEKTKAQAQAEFLISLEGKTAEEIELIRLQLAGKLNDIRNIEVDAVKAANAEILQSEKDLQADREALQDARINSAKNVADILSSIASDDEDTQRSLQRLKKTLAITEILINSNREVAAIRAEITDNETLKRSRIIEARTSAAASVIGVLSAFDGVDDTGGRGDVDSKGGKQWTLHPKEQVHSLKDRQGMADPITGKLRTREEIGGLVNFADNMLMSPHAFKSLEMGNVVNPNDVNLKGFERAVNAQTEQLDSSIKKNAVHVEVGFNNIGEFFKKMKKEGTTRITTAKGDGGFL